MRKFEAGQAVLKVKQLEAAIVARDEKMVRYDAYLEVGESGQRRAVRC